MTSKRSLRRRIEVLESAVAALAVAGNVGGGDTYLGALERLGASDQTLTAALAARRQLDRHS